MTEGRRKTNFEPGMIFTLDHLKKDDLQLDLDSEIARFRAKKDMEKNPAPVVPSESRPRSPRVEPGLK